MFDKGLEGPFQPKPVHRVFRIVDSQFQWKYTWYFNAFLIGSLLLFVLPSWYFLNQNYEIVNGIASKVAPQLIEHLQREQQWLIGFSIFSVFSLFVLTTWVSLKMTGNIVGPLISMERHMWKVTTGDWSANDFRIRAQDDFRELADAYSYLYRSLKAQSESELKLLQKINIDASQKRFFQCPCDLDRTQKKSAAGGKTTQRSRCDFTCSRNWRETSRFLMASRLSWDFFPLTKAISNLTRPFLK